MSSKNLTILRILLILGAVLLLATMLVYPFGEDQATSAVGGDMSIKNGAVAYHDFVDTRPQLIFWIYGTASMIFGHHEWSIRAFDILYHLITLVIFYRVLLRCLKNEAVAFTSVILYVIVYVATGFDQTALAETFVFLPAILLVNYTEQAAQGENAFRNGILAGICGGILFLLKFTFLSASGAAILYLLINRSVDRKHLIRFSIALLSTVLVFIGLYIAYLAATGALDDFLLAMHWLRGYSVATFESVNKAQAGNIHFKMFPNGLLMEYGMTCVVLLCIGVTQVVRTESRLPVSYSHLCLQVLIGLLTVYFEGKSYKYHFARFLFAAIPLIAYGLVTMFQLLYHLYRKWLTLHIFQRLVRLGLIIPVIGLAVLYSPLVRLWKDSVHLTIMHFKGQDVAKEIEDNSQGYYYKQHSMVADSLRPLLKPQDQIFVWGRNVGIYYQLDRLPTTICLTSMPLRLPGWTPLSWQQRVLHSLETNPPRFIIAQFDDLQSELAGVAPSPWGQLENWTELSDMVKAHYSERAPIGHFRIFELNR